MKKLLGCLLGALVLALGFSINASAIPLDLGPSGVPSGTINGAIFERYDVNPAGRGAYGTFLATQGDAGNDSGVNRGYNSDYRPVEFNETNAAPHNHSLLLSDIGQVLVGSDWYYEFALDADQAPGTGPVISLDMLTARPSFKTTSILLYYSPRSAC